jgi:hypothetical protein
MRFLPMSRDDAGKASRLLLQYPQTVSRVDFNTLIAQLDKRDIVCPIRSFPAFESFVPGDGFGPYHWFNRPKYLSALEPFFQFGNVAFILRGKDALSILSALSRRLMGVWLVPLEGKEDGWIILIDDEPVRMADDGLHRSVCSLCGRLEPVKSPEQKQRMGLLGSRMRKNKVLERGLVPERDIFKVDYIHEWFITSIVRDALADFAQDASGMHFEQWNVL